MGELIQLSSGEECLSCDGKIPPSSLAYAFPEFALTSIYFLCLSCCDNEGKGSPEQEGEGSGECEQHDGGERTDNQGEVSDNPKEASEGVEGESGSADEFAVDIDSLCQIDSKVNSERELHKFTFQSIQDYVEYQTRVEPTDEWIKACEYRGGLASKQTDHSFYGESYEVALDYLKNGGWKEGKAIIEQQQKLFFDFVKDNNIQPQGALNIDAMGFRPFMPAYIAGDPDCMMNPHREKSPAMRDNVVRIFLNLHFSVFANTTQAINWGIAISVLIDSLEIQGKSVDVTGIFGAAAIGLDNPNGLTFTRVGLKRADEPVDLERLICAIAYPPTFRRVFMRFMEARSELADKWVDSYGAAFDYVKDDGALYLPCANAYLDQCNTIQEAIECAKSLFDDPNEIRYVQYDEGKRTRRNSIRAIEEFENSLDA